MKKKLKWITIAAAVVVIIAFAAIYGLNAGGVSAQLYEVGKGEIYQCLEETAQVKSIDRYTVYIEGAGMILSLNASVGDTVKKGDLLLTLDKTDLDLQLKNAEAVIAASRAELEGTELVHYANEIDQAKITVNQAKINYDTAQRSFENAKELYESDALSKEEFEKIQDASKVALSILNASELQLADIRKGAPDYIKNGYMAKLEQAEINRDAIVNSLEKQEVRAPADGTVVERLVEMSSPAAPHMPAFVIEDTDRLEIEADILSDDVNKISLGNEVQISGKPLGDEILKGKVKKIAPTAKTELSSLGVNQSRVIVTIEIIGETNLLKPGFSVDVKIITAGSTDVLRVPDSAVFDYEGKSNVFVIEDGKACLRTVTKGIEADDFIEIIEGLQEGELILAKPDNSIKEGMKVHGLTGKDMNVNIMAY